MQTGHVRDQTLACRYIRDNNEEIQLNLISRQLSGIHTNKTSEYCHELVSRLYRDI